MNQCYFLEHLQQLGLRIQYIGSKNNKKIFVPGETNFLVNQRTVLDLSTMVEEIKTTVKDTKTMVFGRGTLFSEAGPVF
jgi:hypothetical protein